MKKTQIFQIFAQISQRKSNKTIIDLQFWDILWIEWILSNRVEERFKLDRLVDLGIQELIDNWEILNYLAFICEIQILLSEPVEKANDVFLINFLFFQ